MSFSRCSFGTKSILSCVLVLIAFKVFAYFYLIGNASYILNGIFPLHGGPLVAITQKPNGWSASEWRYIFQNGQKSAYNRFYSWTNVSHIKFVNSDDLIYICNSSFTNSDVEPWIWSALFLVVSAPNNTEHRTVIRETWGEDILRLGARILFLVGVSTDRSVNEAIAHESSAKNDILIADFRDSYYNLTLKSVILLKWAVQFCSSFRHIVKIDDDVYLNVKNMPKTIEYITGHSIAGNAAVKSSVNRDQKSKWYVPETVYPWDSYPDYLTGYMYTMTMEAAVRLLNASSEVPYFIMEDIYVTGMLSSVAEIKLLGNPSMPTFATPVATCDFLASPQHTPKEMRLKWEYAKSGKLKC